MSIRVHAAGTVFVKMQFQLMMQGLHGCSATSDQVCTCSYSHKHLQADTALFVPGFESVSEQQSSDLSSITSPPFLFHLILVCFVPFLFAVLLGHTCLDATLLITDIWVIQSVLLCFVLQTDMPALIILVLDLSTVIYCMAMDLSACMVYCILREPLLLQDLGECIADMPDCTSGTV